MPGRGQHKYQTVAISAHEFFFCKEASHRTLYPVTLLSPITIEQLEVPCPIARHFTKDCPANERTN
jgi:hypothetical protein